MKIIIKKYHLIWEWQIKQGRKVLFGGYSRTKKDAKNDVSVVMRQNDGAEARHSATSANQ